MEFCYSASEYAPQYVPQASKIEPLAPFGVANSREVIRSIKNLQLHPTIAQCPPKLRAPDGISLMPLSFLPPIIISPGNTILSGFETWHTAKFSSSETVRCIEYQIDEKDVLLYILASQSVNRHWNDFQKIKIALGLKERFRERAIEHMQMGGALKGSAKLPDNAHIDVREQIARSIGVGARNVSKVEAILDRAHKGVVAACDSGFLSIDRGYQLSKLQRDEQVERLEMLLEHHFAPRFGIDPLESSVNTNRILGVLLKAVETDLDSIVILPSKFKQTRIFLGQQHRALLNVQKELNL